MSQPIGGTIAETYLRRRGIMSLHGTGNLRFHPRCYYRPDEHSPTEKWPALIAAVTDLNSKITGAHRTWLAPDGSDKAPIDIQRKAMGDLLGHAVRFGTPALLGLFAILSWHLGTSPPLGSRWEFERASLQTFALARQQPALCGLAVRDTFFDSGGYTYLHRDVPLYYADFDPARSLEGTAIKMRLEIMRHDQPVPQFPGAALDDATAHYNFLVARADHATAGYSPIGCFNDAEREGRPALCLFSRPGGCS